MHGAVCATDSPEQQNRIAGASLDSRTDGNIARHAARSKQGEYMTANVAALSMSRLDYRSLALSVKSAAKPLKQCYGSGMSVIP